MNSADKAVFTETAGQYREGAELLMSRAVSLQRRKRQQDLFTEVPSSFTQADDLIKAHALADVLRTPESCDELICSMQESYQGLAEAIRKKPPVWSLQEILSSEGDGLFTARDALYPDDGKLLYCPELKEGTPFAFSLVLDTPAFRCSIGTAVHITSLLPDDFRFFLAGFRAEPRTPKAFTKAVQSRFHELLTLLAAADAELEEYGNIVLRYYGRHLNGGYAPYAKMLSQLSEKEAGGITCYTYLGPNEDSDDADSWTAERLSIIPPVFYTDENRSFLYLLTSCREDMAAVCSQLARSVPSVPLDAESWEHSAYPHVMDLGKELTGFYAPWDHADRPFMENSESSISPVLMKYFMLAVKQLYAADKGKPFDCRKECEELGIDYQEYIQYIEDIRSKGSEHLISEQDKCYALDHIQSPLPSQAENLGRSLENSGIFRLDQSQSTKDLFLQLAGPANAGKIDLENITYTVEDLFDEEFEDMARLVMNALFFLLLQSEQKWYQLRSYALEIVNIYGISLLDELFMDFSEFAEALSTCAVRKLLPMGVLEAQSRPKGNDRKLGTFNVRPSMFLTRLIRKAY